ncbi:unnamed protein product [Heligmosomoides polygyrus]|uniref:Structural maintenance of chromosomes protein 5 n=1 Tax=Heligmosomoides polygyrus TaxID=6339 RepID=A0A3P7X814_HELPZ|nr:unnamed protein product [Heligmosomoides polygyrus]
MMNTERAGDPKLLEQHEELINKKKHESVHLASAREVQQRLESVEGEISTLLPRVENYKKKEFLRTKIRILQKKKAILDFKECEERFIAQEEALDQLQSIVKKSEKEIEKLQKEKEQKADIEKEYRTKQGDMVRHIRAITEDVDSLTNQNLYNTRVRDAQDRFARLKTQNDSWEQEMNQLRQQVDRVRENVSTAREGMKGYEEFKREASKKAQKYAEEDDNLCRSEDELQVQEKKLSADRNSIREEEKRLDRVMENRVRVLEGLRSNMADEAWRWYEANRNKFRHPVHVPILHMTVPDAKAAVLLENLIAVRDLPMFIFGCKEDEALLTDRRHSWKLNSTVIPPSMVGVCGIESSFRRLTVILRTFHAGGWRHKVYMSAVKGSSWCLLEPFTARH